MLFLGALLVGCGQNDGNIGNNDQVLTVLWGQEAGKQSRIEQTLLPLHMTDEQIRDVLKREDSNDMRNGIAQLPGRGPFVQQLVSAVWKQEREQYEDLNWSVLSRAEVRLVAGQVLFQMGERDNPAFRQLALDSLDAANREVRCQAAATLGVVGQSEDVPHLVSLVKNDDDYVALCALPALMKIPGEDGLRALESLLDEPALSERRRQQIGKILNSPLRATPRG
ncbi:MAG TPA: HEAT repeat domain-containing protein [Steroidobacter sp.]|uniref:HEAT repeat domain-containing protein n=1 Tax=Steroidobacter sp. TaxID=1978227 RepID=UPI002ED7BCCF